MNLDKVNILLIGPKLDEKRKNIGGATLSFSYLIKYFDDNLIQYELINTQRFGGKLKVFVNPLYTFLSFLISIWRSKLVFVNVSQNGVKFLCPIIFVITKSLGKKVVIRPFGGAMKDHYENYAFWQKYIFDKTVLKSDIFYLQTKELMNYFSVIGKNVKQLNTSRYKPDKNLLRGNRPYQRRFMFLGHVKKSKGIDVILDAIRALDDTFTIDIYGSITESEYDFLELEKQPYYKGILDEKMILATMRTYDIVLLPTFYNGEGYPGVLIEAYSLGLPVITTSWKAIPEIVKENETGILIKPKSSDELINALNSINQKKHKTMSDNVIDYFTHNFESNIVIKSIIKDIKEL